MCVGNFFGSTPETEWEEYRTCAKKGKERACILDDYNPVGCGCIRGFEFDEQYLHHTSPSCVALLSFSVYDPELNRGMARARAVVSVRAIQLCFVEAEGNVLSTACCCWYKKDQCVPFGACCKCLCVWKGLVSCLWITMSNIILTRPCCLALNGVLGLYDVQLAAICVISPVMYNTGLSPLCH